MWHPPPEIAPRNCTLINSSFGTLYRPPILDPPIRAPKNSPNSGRSKWPPKRDPTQKHPQNVHPPIRDPQKPPEYTHDSKQNTKHSVWDSKYTPQYVHPVVTSVGIILWGVKFGTPIPSWIHTMIQKMQNTKPPKTKHQKLPFYSSWGSSRKWSTSSKWSSQINTPSHSNPPTTHPSSSSTIRSIIIITINHTTTQKKISSTIQSINHHQKKKFSTKNSSNHQGYTDQKKLMKTSKFIKNMKIIKTMKTPQNEGPPIPPKMDPPTPHRSPGSTPQCDTPRCDTHPDTRAQKKKEKK